MASLVTSAQAPADSRPGIGGGVEVGVAMANLSATHALCRGRERAEPQELRTGPRRVLAKGTAVGFMDTLFPVLPSVGLTIEF